MKKLTILLLTALISSCTSTQLTDSWKNPEIESYAPSKVLVVGITSNIEAATLVEQYPEMAIIPVQEPKYPTPLAWLTPQDDQVWINYLNHWIAIKKAQGFFNKKMDKYKLKSL